MRITKTKDRDGKYIRTEYDIEIIDKDIRFIIEVYKYKDGRIVSTLKNTIIYV